MSSRLQIDKYRATIRFTEDVLGTVPRDRKVFSRFILDKAREEMKKGDRKGVPHANGEPVTAESLAAMAAEEESVQEKEERGWTGFHADRHGVFLFDYMVKGFLKESARTLREYDPSGGGGDEDGDEDGDEGGPKKKARKGVIKQLQDKFSRYVFVLPRKIYFPEAMFKKDERGQYVFENLERPLRAQTAQGPRVTVVRSDLVPVGTEISFQVHVLRGGGVTQRLLETVLEYGVYQGLGQWRSGGYGRFDVVSLERY